MTGTKNLEDLSSKIFFYLKKVFIFVLLKLQFLYSKTGLNSTEFNPVCYFIYSIKFSLK